MERQPAVYILASKQNGTLYIGVTGDLTKRAWKHKNDLVDGFTKKYRVHRMVYSRNARGHVVRDHEREAVEEMERAWKLDLIEEKNPEWKDLWHEIV